MRKTFVSNLLLIIGLNLLVKPVYLLVVEAEIQNRTGEAAFGNYFALISFSFLLNILPDLGLTNWNTRRVATAPHEVISLLPITVPLRAVLAMIYMVVMVVGAVALHYSPEQIGMVALLAVNQVLALFVLFLRSHFSGLHLFKHDSVLSVLDRVLLVGMMSALLWGRNDGVFRIEWLVYGQTVAYAVTALAAWTWLRGKVGAVQLSWKWSAWSPVLRSSLPFAALIFVATVSYRLDSVLLERLGSAADAGAYAMGFRFFEAINMVSYLFATLLLPIFTGMLHRGESVLPVLHTAVRLMLSAGLALVVASAVWGYDAMRLVYTTPTAEAIKSFQWLMPGVLFFSLQYVFGTLITASGRMWHMTLIALVGTALNIGLNVWLIPRFHSEGAAITNATTQAVVLVLQWWYTRRYLGVHMGYEWWRYLLYAAGAVALGYGAVHAIVEWSWTSAQSFVVWAIATLGLAFALGMISVRALLQMLRMKKEAA